MIVCFNFNILLPPPPPPKVAYPTMSMDSFLSLFGPSADDDCTVDTDDDYYFNDPHLPHQHHPTDDPSKTHPCARTPNTPPTNHQRSGAAAVAAASPKSRPDTALMDFDRGRLPPEPQLGNIEYKLKLIEPSAQRFEHLVTQMKWRLREGNGEAIYEIGVSDSGHLHGLDGGDMRASLNTLQRMAQQLGATTTVLRSQAVPGSRGRRTTVDNENGGTGGDDHLDDSVCTVAEVLVRKVPDDQHSIEVRVAVLGSAGAGKSTLLGVLTQGERDNGRGRARLNMFRHMHEIRSGRTSCISHETLGFDHAGAVLNYAHGSCESLSAEAISARASKLVTFMDLAGHRRYMRTTVQALTGYGPHQAIVVVGSGPADDVATGMVPEHLGIVLALDMPFFIVITKTDAAAPGDTLLALQRMLTAAGCRRVPLLVATVDDVLTAATRQLGGTVVPIFCVSNVTGDGLELLTRFLYVLPPGVSNAERERLEQRRAEFHVDEIFKVAGVGGPVIGGLLVQGVLTVGQAMRLGPMADGRFVAVRVRTAHRNKVPCRAVRAGQSASLAVVRDAAGDADDEGGGASQSGDDLAVVVRSGMVLMPSALTRTTSDEGVESDRQTEDGYDEEPFGSLFFQVDTV